MKVRELFPKYGVDNSVTEYLLSHYSQTKNSVFPFYILNGRLDFEPNLMFAYSMHRSWNAVRRVNVLFNLFLIPPSI